MALRKECLDDLAKSGLTPQDVGAREAGAPELAAVKLPSSTIGYIIPYYDIAGKRIPFYRLKLINNAKMKYKQPSGTANHLYFPAQFAQTLQKYLSTKPKRPVILLTEGEKKAVAGCKAGYPTVALGGVDSWRSRTIIMPKETVLSAEGDWLRAKIPSGGESKIDDVGKAIGLQSLFDLCSDKGITLMIVYDTDSAAGVRFEVQRAAAMLAHEAHFRGCKISQIRQLVLPFSEKLGKVGLDDYLVHKNAKALGNLIEGTLNKRSAFPRMPNAKKVLNEKLQSSRLQRSETQMIAAIMLAELDARGRRIRSAKDRQPYYFDEQACKLIPAQLINKQNEPLHEAPFGMYLYKEFGISSADTRVLTWLAAQFTGEEPVESAEPKRVISLVPGNEWEIAIQIGDSHFAIVSADEDFPVRIVTNGSKGLMFEQDQVEDVNPDDLMDAFDEQMEKPLKSWWHEIISAEFRIQGGDDAARLFALLFYISPFLLRWKGTQLPLELLIGEPGSGKSSLFALRLSVLTGRPLLRNVPRDMRDWYSSIVSTGGLHVIDNVAFTNKDLRQGMSDEMAQPLHAHVLTPNGYVCMRDIKVGNQVLTPQGKIATVIQEHPFEEVDIYRVTMTDGSSTECCLNHKWFVQTRDDMSYKDDIHGQVLRLKDIIAQGLRYKGKNQRHKWYIPNIEQGIDLTDSTLDYSVHKVIHPYVLGCLLGDGNLNNKQLWFATSDTEIRERFEKHLPLGTSINSCQKGSYYLRDAAEFKAGIVTLCLNDKLSRTKFIPDAYLYTTANNRLEILRGLMDTDGTVNDVGIASFASVSLQLAEGVKFLVQSLGGRGSIWQRADGAYQVTVGLPNISPFWLSRKTAKLGKRKNLRRAISSVTFVGKMPAKCISLNTTQGRYVTDNFIVTHNCRIVTEPDPHIEMRKLFTTNSQLQIPVSTVFAMTAVQQPFLNSDILQRAAIFELDAILEGHTSDWVGKHMEKFGGRINWLAHHFVALHKFLVAAKEQWDNNYMAGHRLANYEQCLSIMARVLNLQPKGTVKGTKLSTAEEAKWIKKNLAASTQKSIINSDWTYNALKTFCEGVIELHPNGKDFGIHEFTAYFEASNDYYDHPLLINSRPLLRYMQANRTSLERMLGIRDLTHGIVEPSQKKFRIMPLNKEVKEIVEAAENKETKES